MPESSAQQQSVGQRHDLSVIHWDGTHTVIYRVILGFVKDKQGWAEEKVVTQLG